LGVLSHSVCLSQDEKRRGNVWGNGIFIALKTVDSSSFGQKFVSWTANAKKGREKNEMTPVFRLSVTRWEGREVKVVVSDGAEGCPWVKGGRQEMSGPESVGGNGVLKSQRGRCRNCGRRESGVGFVLGGGYIQGL